MHQINVLSLSTLGLSDYLCKGFCPQDSERRNWTYVTHPLPELSAVRQSIYVVSIEGQNDFLSRGSHGFH